MRALANVALVMLTVVLSSCTFRAEPTEPADLVLVNGTIYTVDEDEPWVEAVAIKDELIIAVGANADIQSIVGLHTRTIDLDGAFATAGFNDGHVHVSSTGALLVGVNLLDVHEPVAFADRIRAAAERLPEGSLISGGSWGAYEQWAEGSAGERGSAEIVEPFTPHKTLVDEFTADNPVLVSRFDRTMHLANSRALELAGITNDTPNPAGGEFEKDDAGSLTGILRGTAFARIRSAMPPKSHEQRMIEFEAVQEEARRGGITTIQDLTSPEMLRVYQETRSQGNLTVRVMLRPTLFNVEHIEALGITTGFGDDYLKFVGYKAWVDGIMGGNSALFFEPYDHMPGHYGNLRTIMFPEGSEGAGMSMSRAQKYTDFPPGNLETLLQAAVATGMPAHVHAIGDKGVRILLDIYEKVLKENDLIDSDHRWRMIHAQVVDEDDFKRFGELNLVAEINPYHVSDDMRWMEERIGADRLEGAYAFRTLMENGAVLVIGSDSPGTNAARYFLNPKYGLFAAVSRQTLKGDPEGGWYAEQRLTIEEAIDAYTKNSAWATFDEGVKGTLTPGKLADIAVFDTNLIEAGHENPSALLNAEVLYTIVGGRVVYDASQ